MKTTGLQRPVAVQFLNNNIQSKKNLKTFRLKKKLIQPTRIKMISKIKCCAV